MKPVHRLTSKVPLRDDEEGVSVVLVLILLAVGATIGGVAATGGFSRLAGFPVATDSPLGLDEQLARDIFGKTQPFTGSGPAGTTSSGDTSTGGTTTSPTGNPEGGPGCCPGGDGIYAVQAAGPGPIDWAIIAFVLILVFGAIAAKVRLRGPAFGIVVLVVVVGVVAAAVGTAAQGVDWDGDGDVDDVRDVREAGFSGTLVFDGTIAYTDGSSEDLHSTTPLLALAQRGGKEVASLVLQVVLVHGCDGCEARLTGGFVAFAASRPQNHAEGPFFKEGPRMDIPALTLQKNVSLELWRVAFDGVRLQSAIGDADGLGTYFLNLVGQLRLSIVNETGNPAPLVVDFAWPNAELRILDTTAEDQPFVGPGGGCFFSTCVFAMSIVGGSNLKWWYLTTTDAPEASSQAVLEDFGVIG
jgi:hypothetical protein